MTAEHASAKTSLFSVGFDEEVIPEPTIDQFLRFPGTRYMGSKNRILPSIWEHLKALEFDSFLDVFAGSNVVSYFMRCKGKKVITNDFLRYSFTISKAIIENSSDTLDSATIQFLLTKNKNDGFVQNTFNGIFFSDEENAFIDRVRTNINNWDNEYERSLALASLARACVKKRSRGIFTFVGERYNDGRRDMRESLMVHFLESVAMFNEAVFDNGRDNQSLNMPAEDLSETADLVYLDPPYYSPKSDNDYVRRYHFVEGLCRNWKDLEIQEHTAVKKFKSFVSPFSRRDTAYSAFEKLFEKHQKSKIVVSYSSNSFPTKTEIYDLLSKYKKDVVCHEISLTYSFGNQGNKVGNINNRVQEYLFIGQ